MTIGSLRFHGRGGGFNQLPELRVLLQRLVLLHLESGTVEKVLERVAVEDAMDQEPQFVPLEIDAVIADPKAVQDAAGPFEFAELIQLGVHHLLRESAEPAQDLQLQFFGHARQFRRAGRIEDDLKRTHETKAVASRPGLQYQRTMQIPNSLLVVCVAAAACVVVVCRAQETDTQTKARAGEPQKIDGLRAQSRAPVVRVAQATAPPRSGPLAPPQATARFSDVPPPSPRFDLPPTHQKFEELQARTLAAIFSGVPPASPQAGQPGREVTAKAPEALRLKAEPPAAEAAKNREADALAKAKADKAAARAAAQAEAVREGLARAETRAAKKLADDAEAAREARARAKAAQEAQAEAKGSQLRVSLQTPAQEPQPAPAKAEVKPKAGTTNQPAAKVKGRKKAAKPDRPKAATRAETNKGAQAHVEAQAKAGGKKKEALPPKGQNTASPPNGALTFTPIVAPPLPISVEKQQKLGDLLRKYQADEITPEQYHEQRAKILAGP